MRKNCCNLLITNLSGEVGSESPAFRQAIGRATSKVIKLIAEDMQTCQQQGCVRTDLSPNILATLIWDCWQGALLRMKVEDSRAPLRQTLALLWEHILPPANDTTERALNKGPTA